MFLSQSRPHESLKLELAVEKMIQFCRKGPKGAEVTGVKVSKETYTQEYHQQAEIAINRNEN